MRSPLFTQLSASVRIVAIMTLTLGIAYPLAMTALAQTVAPGRADGQLVGSNGAVVGSRLLGQSFSDDGYFQSRPSAAGYDGAASSGSNLGPTNPDLLAGVAERVEAYRRSNGLSDDVRVPVDAVTSSASGLDPHISPANARLQARRVAEVRKLEPERIVALVDTHVERRPLGFLGDEVVNVLALNLALDELAAVP